MPKKFKSAQHKKAAKEHDAWLRKRGLKFKTRPKNTNTFPDLSCAVSGLPETSDVIGGDPTIPLHDPEYYAAVAEKAKSVAQVANKGHFSVITNKENWVASRRRIN